MNRAVDYRADFYALGVTFHQMLSGELPFAADYALEWVHCYVARTPRPLAARVPGLTEPLSDLVAKLLAKLAEHRYQSAAGLRADLAECRRQWVQSGRIDAFGLGRDDLSERFQLPQQLYGREAEAKAPQDAFAEVVASSEAAFVLVTGYAGIGKSALVAELHKPVVAQRGNFIAAKFDQYQRDIPYAPILAALGDDGSLLVDLIPPLALLVGAQPLVAELPPEAAQQRSHSVIERFIGVLPRRPAAGAVPRRPAVDRCRQPQPAVVVVDQRHGASPAAGRRLPLIEVDPAHPLALLLDDAQRMLGLASLLGNGFSASTLALVGGQDEDTTESDLWPALEAGPLTQHDGHWRFLHDRIQDAAHALTPPASRPALHLRIRRLVLAHGTPEDLDGIVFQVANHLNQGAALLREPAERRRVAELDLRAGRRARRGGAGTRTGAGARCRRGSARTIVRRSDACPWPRRRGPARGRCRLLTKPRRA